MDARRRRIALAGAAAACVVGAVLACRIEWADGTDGDWRNFWGDLQSLLVAASITMLWALRSPRWWLLGPVTYVAIGIVLFAFGNREYGPFKGPDFLLQWPRMLLTYEGHRLGLHHRFES